MKKITLFILFTLSSFVFFAQVKETVEEVTIETMVEEEVEEDVEDSDVPFSRIEEVPIYPGCKGSKSELRKCLQYSIQKHVAKNFNTNLSNELGLSAGKIKVYVVFMIDKNGDIVNVRARGPHKRLEMEGIEVVKSLPKMKPGKMSGRLVGVRYTLPITLLIEADNKAEQEIETNQENIISEAVDIEDEESEDMPFAIIEDAPIFPGCEKLDKNLRKMCMQNQIKKHVAANFNVDLANDLGLDSGKKRVYVVFKIDKNGDVVDLRARGPHKRLEMEAMRVAKLLPKMTPGKHRGKPVGVKYTLPITLLVEGTKENEDPNEN